MLGIFRDSLAPPSPLGGPALQGTNPNRFIVPETRLYVNP